MTGSMVAAGWWGAGAVAESPTSCRQQGTDWDTGQYPEHRKPQSPPHSDTLPPTRAYPLQQSHISYKYHSPWDYGGQLHSNYHKYHDYNAPSLNDFNTGMYIQKTIKPGFLIFWQGREDKHLVFCDSATLLCVVGTGQDESRLTAWWMLTDECGWHPWMPASWTESWAQFLYANISHFTLWPQHDALGTGCSDACTG